MGYVVCSAGGGRMSDQRWGYYSQVHANMQDRAPGGIWPGPIWYATPTGDRVLVTCIGRSENPLDIGYMWPDAVCVGEVTHYIGRVRAVDA